MIRTAYRKDRLLRWGDSGSTGRSNLVFGMVGSDGVGALASNIGVSSHAAPICPTLVALLSTYSCWCHVLTSLAFCSFVCCGIEV